MYVNVDRKIENLLDVCMCYLVMWLSSFVFVIYRIVLIIKSLDFG